MKLDKETALVESILFLEDRPIDEAGIAAVSDLSVNTVRAAINILVERYGGDHHGILPVKLAEGWMFSPKEDLWPSLKGRYGKRHQDPLSRAALEVLSIIAYSQPLTRAEIENIRGVGAENMIRMLKEKKLIKELGRKEVPGRPFFYGTTKEFLELFRLESIADLPKLDEVDKDRFASDD